MPFAESRSISFIARRPLRIFQSRSRLLTASGERGGGCGPVQECLARSDRYLFEAEWAEPERCVDDKVNLPARPAQAAYTKEAFIRVAAQSRFGICQINVAPIGIEVRFLVAATRAELPGRRALASPRPAVAARLATGCFWAVR